MVVVGIDPGMAITGYGVIREAPNGDLLVIDYGVVRTTTDKTIEQRLLQLYNSLKKILLLHCPDSAAVEKLFFQKNVSTAMAVGQARGVALLALAEAGFETYFYQQKWSHRSMWGKEQEKIADWLRSLPKPIGLMACNDNLARLVLSACRIAKIDVPHEVSVIGVDNNELICRLATPSLSSIALSDENTGYEVAKLLDKLMAGKKVKPQVLLSQPTHVITRQSTDVMAIEDQQVIKAVQFIKENTQRMIQVSDVIDVVNVSRQTLERRFRKILNRPIYDEIKHTRIKLIAQMLLETNLSVFQIASKLGSSNPNHLARSFRQTMGISPTAYRKKYGPK